MLPTPYPSPLRPHAHPWRLGLFVFMLAAAAVAGLMPPDWAPVLVWPWGGVVSDKVLHALGFMALGLAAWFAGRGTFKVLLALALAGIGIELAQGLLGWGRSGDVRDALANALGLAAALVVIGIHHQGAWRLMLPKTAP
jgi:hypothetical protein